MNAIDPAEAVEQGYLFELLRDRHARQIPMQELLAQVRYELLTTTKLPMAVDYLLTELRHSGLMAPAMRQLSHYFTPFQAFLVSRAEEETGRFLMLTALQILEGEAKYRATIGKPDGATAQGMFFYHFEAICRNRLPYDEGLTAASSDPIYDKHWARWILSLRAELGLVDLADLILLSSDEYAAHLEAAGRDPDERAPYLFGKKEGRIAIGNRGKDPLYLFSAMQRHLGYPAVPKLEKQDDRDEIIPQMARRIERMEARIKILEEEARGGIDLTKFYEK